MSAAGTPLSRVEHHASRACATLDVMLAGLEFTLKNAASMKLDHDPVPEGLHELEKDVEMYRQMIADARASGARVSFSEVTQLDFYFHATTGRASRLTGLLMARIHAKRLQNQQQSLRYSGD